MAIKYTKLKKSEKIKLETEIKDEISHIQEKITDCTQAIKDLKEENLFMFPLYNCRLHCLENYKEALENIKY